MKNIKLLVIAGFLLTFKLSLAQSAYIGEIRLMSTNFVPRFWLKCEGQLLPINQNQALFSLLGTTYGGNGQTNFALPDFRGRANVGSGNGYNQGQQAGSETVTLSAANLPSHAHDVAFKVNTGDATSQVPAAGSHLSKNVVQAGATNLPGLAYNNLATNVNLACGTTTAAGATTPTAITVVQPYLAMTYMICTQGIFPSQN